MKTAKRLVSLVLIINIIIVCLCSCSSAENSVITDNLLDLMQENDYFEFYYKSRISAFNSRNESYKIMYLSYDLNDDGTNEDICYLVPGSLSETTLDIFDTDEGADIGAKTEIDVNSNSKIQVLKHKTNGYHDLKYIFISSSGKVEDAVIMRMTIDGNTGYYSEAKK